MSHALVCRALLTCVTWRTQRCQTLDDQIAWRKYVWHEWLYVYVPWFVHVCNVSHVWVCHDFLMHAAWLIQRWQTLDDEGAWRKYVWLDSSICVTWLVRVCECLCHCFCKSVAWLTDLCGMNHSKMTDSRRSSCLVHVCVTWRIHVCVTWPTRMCVWHDLLYLWHDPVYMMPWRYRWPSCLAQVCVT